MSREPIRDRLMGSLIRFFDWADQKIDPDPEPKKRTRLPGELGRWYDTGLLQRIVSVPPWVSHPDGPLETSPRCPGCGATEGLALLWLPGSEHLARFHCPRDECRVSWIDPMWARADVTEFLQQHMRERFAPTWDSPQGDTDPGLQELAEHMRYEAGTDRHDKRRNP